MIFSSRRPSVTALVGTVPVGSAHPVVVQAEPTHRRVPPDFDRRVDDVAGRGDDLGVGVTAMLHHPGDVEAEQLNEQQADVAAVLKGTPRLVQDALRGMVRNVLADAAKTGAERRVFPRKEVNVRIEGKRLDHTVEARQMGMQARKRVRSHFGRSQMCHGLDELYAELLGLPAPLEPAQAAANGKADHAPPLRTAAGRQNGGQRDSPQFDVPSLRRRSEA